MNLHEAFFRLEEGLAIMCIGLGVVFFFLIILVWAMGVMSKVVGHLNKLFPEAVQETGHIKKTNVSEEEAVAVAILAAITKN